MVVPLIANGEPSANPGVETPSSSIDKYVLGAKPLLTVKVWVYVPKRFPNAGDPALTAPVLTVPHTYTVALIAVKVLVVKFTGNRSNPVSAVVPADNV